LKHSYRCVIDVRRRTKWLAALMLFVATLAVVDVRAQTPPAAPPQQPAAPAPAASAPAGTPPAAPATAPAPAPVAAPAPPVLPPEVLDPVTRLAKSIEGAEKSISQLKELEGELSRLRADVERIIYDSTATAEQLRPQLDEVKRQIEKLGPPPAAGQPSETPTVAAERARLNAMAGALDSAVKTTELAWVRAKQLIDRITVMRYQIFTRNLFERRDSPLKPSVWSDVSSRMDGVMGRVRYYGGDWLTWASRKSRELTALVLGVGVLFAGLYSLTRRFLARHLVRPAVSPSFFDRASRAAWVAPTLALPAAAAALALYAGLDALDLIYDHWAAFGLVLLEGLLIFAAASAMLRTALAPKLPAWRLIPLSDVAAARVLWLLEAFVGVYVFDTVLTELSRIIYVPLTVTIAQTFLTSCLFVVVLAATLLTRFEPQAAADRPVNGHHDAQGMVSRLAPRWIKVPLWLVAGAILVTSLLGYVALGRFVAHQLVLSSMVLAAAGVCYLAIRAATRGRQDGRVVVGELLETRFGLDQSRQRQLVRLLEVMLTLVLFLIAVPLLLLQWGFQGAEIRDWFKSAVFGFEVGHLKISPARILIGIGLFTGLLFLTRLVQRWLREGVLTQSRMDVGISNSIDMAVGYAGITLAALLAVSYAGFDITSLAIVAGALSVGIGFGLQSIVNNFVSGLILLVERPIKVGDWVALGDQQGNVRRISVRSTEIETFDKASLIVPNSELISGRVLNWTHRNLLGRVVIKFSLDGSADPEKVLKILLDCARANPQVMKTPEPLASLENFGPGLLEFALRATIGDVNRGLLVMTDLRLQILKELRRHNQIVSAPVVAVTAGAVPVPVA
jgi:potassium-dependent mechanosensitive channel